MSCIALRQLNWPTCSELSMNQVTDKGGKVPWGFLNAWATANYLAQGPMWQAPLRLLSLFTSALVQPCNPFQT
eukprot:scaffold185887_cov15-Tisochrysis_lutea.AAC.1